jgi:Right handed beta helix region
MLFSLVRASKFALPVLLFLAVCTSAWGQANVNEGLETAFIYVDVKSGSDSHPGTKTEPLKTIEAAAKMAMANNQKGVGSRVIINPGTYRESIAIGKGFRSTSLPITFEAATSGTVFVSGADLMSGWVPYSKNPEIYTQSWPYRWGLCTSQPTAPTEQNIILRKEMIVVNGKVLTEVLSLASMKPGTFFPNESNSTVYVWPAVGTNMGTADVEVATRSFLFNDIGQSNVVLRGLTFQYANSCNHGSAVSILSRAQNVLLDHDTFVWNNAAGLMMDGSVEKFTVQNSVASHNGQVGFITSQVKNGLWQSDTISYNNWRGAQGAFYVWDRAGAKFLLDHGSTFNNLTAIYNQAHGVHFDTDNKNATLNSLVSANNAGTGLYAEKDEGPISVSNSSICRNNLMNNAFLGGVSLRDSSFVSLRNTTVYGNGTAQVYLIGQPGGFQITDWETGALYIVENANLGLSGARLAGPASYQTFSDGSLNGPDWTRFATTLKSNNNTWWAGSNSHAFSVPVPKKWTNLDLSNWRSLTGQDSNSNWGAVSSPAACSVASQGRDFWLLMMTNTAHPIVTNSAGVATWNFATVPMGGMTGTVNLSLDGLSAIRGASASFSPNSISTSSGSVLTLHTSGTTPAGTYPLTIIGNSGNVTHTMTVSVTVVH